MWDIQGVGCESCEGVMWDIQGVGWYVRVLCTRCGVVCDSGECCTKKLLGALCTGIGLL